MWRCVWSRLHLQVLGAVLIGGEGVPRGPHIVIPRDDPLDRLPYKVHVDGLFVVLAAVLEVEEGDVFGVGRRRSEVPCEHVAISDFLAFTP